MATAGTGSEPAHQLLVEAGGLSRFFGRQCAADGVDLAVAPGECFVIFGPNGAGKTTLLRLLAGLLRPSAGTARVLGEDPRTDSTARASLGLLTHQTLLYDELTAAENVALSARLHGLSKPADAAATILREVGAAEVAAMRVRFLSRGMQQRVALARALVHRPLVLLADEPFTSLDETGMSGARRALRSVLERGGCAVLVTHNIAEGLDLATRAAVMHRGRFVRVDDRAVIEPAAYTHDYKELSTRAA